MGEQFWKPFSVLSAQAKKSEHYKYEQLSPLLALLENDIF